MDVKPQTRFVIAVVVVLTGSAAGFTISQHARTKPTVAPRQTAVAVEKPQPPAQEVSAPLLAAVATPEPPAAASPTPSPKPAATPALVAKSAKNKGAAAQSKPKAPPKPKEPIQDPLAREALGYVGADPLAEQYWVAAINDFSLPADERRELIEDLNEDGFADPKHLTQDDVPMIISRLQLIEAIAPDSQDQINSAAFQEAYKDLVNMLAKVQ